jgi:hypothetical protein
MAYLRYPAAPFRWVVYMYLYTYSLFHSKRLKYETTYAAYASFPHICS